MAFILLAIFILIPIIEIAFIIEVGGFLGFWMTIGLILLTAVIGSYLIRLQGIGVIRRLQNQLGRQEPPVQEIVDGAALVLAGVMLLTPGFFTDMVGFLLLIPPLRQILGRAIKMKMSSFNAASDKGSYHSKDTIIDLEAEDITEKSNNMTEAALNIKENEKNPNSPWHDG